MPPTVTVVVPTLAGDARLVKCLASLERQTMIGVRVVVVDNSGCGAIHRLGAGGYRFRLIENKENVGFGAAVNQGFRLAPADYVATLNDDAVADERWLEESVAEMEQHAEVGMVAPQIVLSGSGRLDSAGMLMGRDGSSKQRGHGEAAAGYGKREEVLLPSGCAAVYRSAMLREVGLFAEDFFLYCEDTDLGLRGRWAGWTCVYVPEAQVEHGYSQSAGRASERKAWLVERNRMRVAVRCLPATWLWMSPAWTAARYFWHGALMLGGKGKAGEYREGGGSAWRLAALVVQAHVDAMRRIGELLRERGEIRRTRRVSSQDFVKLLKRHAISARQVAAQ